MENDLRPFDEPITLQEKRRIELQEMFEGLLGSENVYFEPPESVKLKYPCIIYERTSGRTEFADNNPYTFKFRYTVTVIDKDPDSRIPEKLASEKYCTFDRGFTNDNLYHYVFTIY